MLIESNRKLDFRSLIFLREVSLYNLHPIHPPHSLKNIRIYFAISLRFVVWLTLTLQNKEFVNMRLVMALTPFYFFSEVKINPSELLEDRE